MTSKKDMLATLIFALKDVSPEDQLMKLQQFAVDSRFPKYEVRTVDSKGSLLIKIPDREWIKPMEWAINHRNTIERKMKEDLERVLGMGARPELKPLGYVGITKSTASEVIPKLIKQTGITDLSEVGYYSADQNKSVLKSVIDRRMMNSPHERYLEDWCLQVMNEVLSEIRDQSN